jgi:hypothetical protein
MVKRLIIILILMACPAFLHAQQLTVSATVIGSNGPWANGTAHASLVCPGNEQAYSGPTPIARDTPTVGLDSNGHFSQVLFDTSQLKDVNGNALTTCHYVFRITERCGISNFSTGPLTGITGAGPVDLTSQINAFTVPLSVGCVVGGGGSITGSGAAGEVTFWTGATSIGGDAQFTWDNVNKKATIGPTLSGLPTDLVPILSETIGLFVGSNTPFPGTAGNPGIAASFINKGATDATALAVQIAGAVSGNATSGVGAETDCYASPGLGNTVASCVGQNGGVAIAAQGTLTDAIGMNYEIDTEAAGTITNATNFNVPTNHAAAGGSFGTIYGVRHRAQTAGGTANYVDYFDDEGSGANNYGIFQAGSSTKNTFATATVNDLTASNLVCTDSNKHLVSTAGCPSQYAKLRCDTGLGDGLNAVAAGTYLQTNCYNDSGVTWTITRIGCFTDNAGSSTLNATNGAATGLLTGAVTCTAAAGGAAGTQSATTTIASGDVIKFTWVADGTSKQTSWFVSLSQ